MLFLVYLWFVYAIPSGKGLKPALLGAMFAVIVGFFALTFGFELVADTSVGARFERFMDRGTGSLTSAVEENIRYEMYVEGLRIFAHRPVFGVGLNNFGAHFWSGQYSHSNYIEPLATTGFIGFILFQAILRSGAAPCVALAAIRPGRRYSIPIENDCCWDDCHWGSRLWVAFLHECSGVSFADCVFS